MNSLFDPCARKHRGNPESEAANRDAAPRKQAQRDRILALIKRRGEYGATADEIAQDLGTPLNRLSGRFSEMKALGLIERKMERGYPVRRATRSGSLAGVFCAVSRDEFRLTA